MFGGTAHVVLGSGLTIAGATFCLHFTNLPYFQTLGIPLAIGMVVVVAAALTLGPAVISVATRFRQTLEPKRTQRIRGWRKIGALRGPVARTDPGRDDRDRTCRPADAARIPHQLQRPQLSARRSAGERGLRGRGSALLQGADESRSC